MKRIARAVLAVLLLLSGCGRSSPAEYEVGGNTLPALEALVDLPAACTITTRPEAENTVYTYTGLSRGGRIVCSFVRQLVTDWQCSVIDDSCAAAPLPDFNGDSGQILIGSPVADGIFRLELHWTAGSCTVTPSLLPGKELQKAESVMMTVDEAIAFLRQLPPPALELTGSTMDAYDILAEDAMVMVNNRMCYCLNLYDAVTHAIRGTRLVAANGRSFYRLDRDADTVTELLHPRLYQTSSQTL